MSPAPENSLSNATDVVGDERYSCGIINSVCGYSTKYYSICIFQTLVLKICGGMCYIINICWKRSISTKVDKQITDRLIQLSVHHQLATVSQ